MSEHDQIIDDAKRYTYLVLTGGWRDPDVDPIKMLAEVIEAHDSIVDIECDAIREEQDERCAEKEAERKGELQAIFDEIGIGCTEHDDLEDLIKLLGEHYRKTTRAEVEAAEGKAEEAERARIELEERLATAEHELSYARNLAKHAIRTARSQAPKKSSPTRKRAVKGRGAGPPRRKR